MYITVEKLKKMAEKEGLTVLEDIYVVLANDKRHFPINPSGSMDKPPYDTLYDKKEVQAVIEFLAK